jgi:glutathione synthase
MIVKPIHSAQSKDVHKIKLRNQCFSKNDLQILNALTQNETQPIVAQKFLKKIMTGETRLWFCEGTLIAAVKKVPHGNQFKINMDGGSTLKPHQLSTKEMKVSQVLSKHLKKEKIDLAAIDLIDGYVTDYNYTSPGLLKGIEKTLKKDLATGIVRRMARTWR